MPAYDQQAIQDLVEATRYESWLLEAAYSIVEDSLFPEWPDQMIYPPSGGEPVRSNFMRGNIVIGDWRPEFLRVGAPLIFVTTFKLLDMLIEWILNQNGHPPTHQFAKKISAINGSGLIFPQFIALRGWLQDRLIALYEKLDPLRGTIIHARHFNTTNGTLVVSSSKRGIVGAPISLAPQEIRALAVLIISVLRYLDGTWQPNAYREKVLRQALDDLTHLHALPSLNQQQPLFMTVRAYFIQKNEVAIDVKRIRNDVSSRLPDYDVVFDVRLIALVLDGNCRAASYLLPWGMIKHENESIVRSIEELSTYESALPNDFDVQMVASELLAAPENHRVAG